MSVGTAAVRFVVDPFSLVDITIGVEKHALSIGFTVQPLTLILAPVKPFLLTVTFAHITKPFTLICCTVIEGNDFMLLSHRTLWLFCSTVDLSFVTCSMPVTIERATAATILHFISATSGNLHCRSCLHADDRLLTVTNTLAGAHFT